MRSTRSWIRGRKEVRKTRSDQSVHDPSVDLVVNTSAMEQLRIIGWMCSDSVSTFQMNRQVTMPCQ